VTLGGVVSMPPPLLHAGAPDGFTGAVASLLIVTGADVAQLPAVSVVTAWIPYAPVASDPVVHQSSTVQLVALHVFCSTTPPRPPRSRCPRPSIHRWATSLPRPVASYRHRRRHHRSLSRPTDTPASSRPCRSSPSARRCGCPTCRTRPR